jgi:hypothetical protein
MAKVAGSSSRYTRKEAKRKKKERKRKHKTKSERKHEYKTKGTKEKKKDTKKEKRVQEEGSSAIGDKEGVSVNSAAPRNGRGYYAAGKGTKSEAYFFDGMEENDLIDAINSPATGPLARERLRGGRGENNKLPQNQTYASKSADCEAKAADRGAARVSATERVAEFANGAAGFYRIRDVKQANKWNEKLKKYVKVQDARRPEIATVFSNDLEARESGEGVSRVFCSLCGKFVGGQNFSKWAVADHIYSDTHQAKLNAVTKDEKDNAVVKGIFDEASAGERVNVEVEVEEKVRLFRVKVVKIFLGKGLHLYSIEDDPAGSPRGLIEAGVGILDRRDEHTC